MSKLKPIPKFKSEDEERDFWATHSSVDYLDWSKAIVNPVFPNLKPSNKTTPLRLLANLLDWIEQATHSRNPPYSREQNVS